MRHVNASIVAALIASAGLASAAVGASQNYNLGNLAVGDIPSNVYETPLAAPGFNPTRAQFTTDWVAGGGGPYSSEAIWAIADGPLASAVDFYFDPGAAPDSFDDGLPESLSWDVYRAGYDTLTDISAGPLQFIAAQTWTGSTATWNNSLLILSDDAAPAPTNYIDLGVVASEGVGFVLDTEGSDFDTELGFFNSFGGVGGADDDSGSGVLSLLSVPGLPAGDYYFNAGGFNTIYGAGGFEALVDGSFGSEGGSLNLNIDGSSVYSGVLDADTNQFFKITVVPTPSTLAMVGLAGLAGLRRRR